MVGNFCFADKYYEGDEDSSTHDALVQTEVILVSISVFFTYNSNITN